MVRAKFKCEKNSEGNISLRPVYSAEPGTENRKYWESTPAGKIELLTVNKAAADQFEVGAEYFVDFTNA